MGSGGLRVSDDEASTPDLSELDAFALRNGDKCWYAELPDDATKATLTAALASDYSNPTISKWLQSKGHDITQSQIRHHRNRLCKCR